MFLLAVLIPVGINYASKAVGKAEKIPTEQEIAQKATPVDVLKSFFKGKTAEKPQAQNKVVSSKAATIKEIFIPEPETIANYYKDLQSKH
jgi:hypothetical protein